MKTHRIKKLLYATLLLSILFSTCTDPAGPGPGPDPVLKRFIAVGGSGIILISDDNGVTYTPVTSGTTETLRGIAADTQGHCVAVGMAGTVRYSDDYGDTWDTGASDTTNQLNRVISYGTNNFMAVAEATGGDPYGIFTSTNGGQTWSKYAVTVTLHGIGNRSSTDLLAVGNIYLQSEAALYLTYTAGASGWTLYSESGPDYDIPSGTGILKDVVGTASSNFVAVGSGGSVYSATGGDWTTGGSVIGTLTAVTWSATPGRIVTVGYGSGGGVTKGRIYYATSSTGTSWTEVDAGTIDLLFDVTTDGSGRFVAVGAAGEAIYSSAPLDPADYAKAWQEGTSGVSEELYGVCYVPQPE